MGKGSLIHGTCEIIYVITIVIYKKGCSKECSVCATLDLISPSVLIKGSFCRKCVRLSPMTKCITVFLRKTGKVAVLVLRNDMKSKVYPSYLGSRHI